MKAIFLVIALGCLFGEINAANTAVSWSSYYNTQSKNTVTEYTNGWMVKFNTAGDVISENLDLSAATATEGPTVWVTPTVSSGQVGVGIVMTSSTGCDSTELAKIKAKTVTTLAGTGTSTAKCPADMFTVYTGSANPTTPTSTSESTVFMTTAVPEVYTVIAPGTPAATSTCFAARAGTSVAGQAAVGSTTCSSNTKGGQYALTTATLTTNKYAMYVEYIGTSTATVCIQNPTQYAASTVDGKTVSGAGNCGSSKASSASLVGAFMAPIVFVALMIFA